MSLDVQKSLDELRALQQKNKYDRKILTKQERRLLQALKNRESAQRHRDSRKQMVQGLQEQVERLRIENEALRQQLAGLKQSCRCGARLNSQTEDSWQRVSTSSRNSSFSLTGLMLICCAALVACGMRGEESPLAMLASRSSFQSANKSFQQLSLSSSLYPTTRLSDQARQFKEGNFLAEIGRDKSQCIRELIEGDSGNLPVLAEQKAIHKRQGPILEEDGSTDRDIIHCGSPLLIRNFSTLVLNRGFLHARMALQKPLRHLSEKFELVLDARELEQIALVDGKAYASHVSQQRLVFRLLAQVIEVQTSRATCSLSK